MPQILYSNNLFLFSGGAKLAETGDQDDQAADVSHAVLLRIGFTTVLFMLLVINYLLCCFCWTKITTVAEPRHLSGQAPKFAKYPNLHES
ncbi:hypothetical protein CPC08DRAFT_120562 [Agrocybe pediades]|nr:hypothetical protein CPC08DRAFT_120562 [Agrocybe pediades]